jgi:hypothetical protein
MSLHALFTVLIERQDHQMGIWPLLLARAVPNSNLEKNAQSQIRVGK